MKNKKITKKITNSNSDSSNLLTKSGANIKSNSANALGDNEQESTDSTSSNKSHFSTNDNSVDSFSSENEVKTNDDRNCLHQQLLQFQRYSNHLKLMKQFCNQHINPSDNKVEFSDEN